MGRQVSLGGSFLDLSAILKQAPIFLAVHDRQRRLQWASSFAFGNGPELIGRRTEQNIHPSDVDAYLHAARMALDTGTSSHGVFRCLMPDGGPLMRMGYRISAYRRGERIIGYLVACWDVTFDRQIQPLASFVLTERSRRIVDFLNQNGPAKGVVIGRHLGELSSDRKQAASKVRVTLAGLEERGILRNTSAGYAVTAEFLAAFVGP